MIVSYMCHEYDVIQKTQSKSIILATTGLHLQLRSRSDSLGQEAGGEWNELITDSSGSNHLSFGLSKTRKVQKKLN